MLLAKLGKEHARAGWSAQADEVAATQLLQVLQIEPRTAEVGAAQVPAVVEGDQREPCFFVSSEQEQFAGLLRPGMPRGFRHEPHAKSAQVLDAGLGAGDGHLDR